MKAIAAITFALLLSGCSSISGARWYNPTTRFSGSEGRAVAKTEGRLATASTEVLKAAQKTAHETQLALVAAPESRPVEVARESNDATVSALDQIAGPLSVAEAAALRTQVAGLLSEVAKERAAAEQERQARRDNLASASQAIDELNVKLKAQQQELKAGFERENAVANAYRNVKFWIYVAIGAWIFVAFILPILGRAFPVVGAVASVGQSIVAPFAVAAASGTKRLAGDLVGGIHELREKLKAGPLTKDSADEILKQWITEADGTAAKVDQLRREKALI